MSTTGRLTLVAFLCVAACQSTNAASIPDDAGNGSDAMSTGDARSDAQPVSCTAPSDCTSFSLGPAIACCFHDTCVYGEATQVATCADAATQNIMASSYDQSCQKDSDCVAIEEGNFCHPGANNGCTNAAINKSALPRYQADLAKTQAGVCYGLSGCPEESGPCCQNGRCGVNAQCGILLFVDDASADAMSTSAADAGDASTDDASTDAERSDAADASTDAERSDAADAGTD